MGKAVIKKLLTVFFIMLFCTFAGLFLRETPAVGISSSPNFREKGPSSAKIIVFEFSDLGCPACKLAHMYLREIAAAYPDKIQINFKYYPLTEIHPNSLSAAIYADCAGEQGKFWEFSDLLFSEQEKWVRAENFREIFKKYSIAAGLDQSRLDACISDPKTADSVRLDISQGDIKGVDATPTFFINGKRAVGPMQMMDRIRYLAVKEKMI